MYDHDTLRIRICDALFTAWYALCTNAPSHLRSEACLSLQLYYFPTVSWGKLVFYHISWLTYYSYCFATTSKYDVSPWYWCFRRHCKFMGWCTRLEMSWCRALTSYCLNSKTNFWECKLFNTSGPSQYSYVLLLELSKLTIHCLLKAMEHRFIFELFHKSACDTKGSAWLTSLF